MVGVICVEQLEPVNPIGQVHPQSDVDVPPFKQVIGTQGVLPLPESEEQLIVIIKNVKNATLFKMIFINKYF